MGYQPRPDADVFSQVHIEEVADLVESLTEKDQLMAVEVFRSAPTPNIRFLFQLPTVAFCSPPLNTCCRQLSWTLDNLSHPAAGPVTVGPDPSNPSKAMIAMFYTRVSSK